MASGNILATKGDFLSLRTWVYLLAWTRNLMKRKESKDYGRLKDYLLGILYNSCPAGVTPRPRLLEKFCFEEHVAEIPERSALTLLVTE